MCCLLFVLIMGWVWMFWCCVLVDFWWYGRMGSMFLFVFIVGFVVWNMIVVFDCFFELVLYM